LDVGDANMQDHPYFAAIAYEMENGGREALLHLLPNHSAWLRLSASSNL
jgi:hypothetical protein